MDDPITSGTTEGFGLMFFNARWLDPAIGRFAQADSIVPPGVQGLDRYAYANNSPLVYTDPSGHCASKREDDLKCWEKAYDIIKTYDIVIYPNEDVWDLTTLQWLSEILGEFEQFIGAEKFAEAIRGGGIYIDDVMSDAGYTSSEGNIYIDPDVFTNDRQGYSVELFFKGTIAHELTHRWALKNPNASENDIKSDYGNAAGWTPSTQKSWYSWVGELFGQKWGYKTIWESSGTGPTWYSNQGNPIEDLAETVSALIVVFPTERLITQDRLDWIDSNMR
jgi:RHS repeat-associated protein